MIEQSRLDGTTSTISPATGRPLRPRQQAAFDLVRSTPGGITAADVGAYLHSRRWWTHAPDEHCVWCEAQGQSVLRSKALRPLVIRRRTGLWEPRDKKHARTLEGGAAGGLPGDTFEDIFGGAAA